MKVSITFDKNLKQSNKKQWVKQIQTVVNKLNSKASQQITPIKSPKNSIHSQEQQPRNSFSSQRQSNRIDEGVLIQLISMQKIMEDKFSTLTGSIVKLTDKLNHVEKRLTVLQNKQANRQNSQQDFDRHFAQLSLKYDKVKRGSHLLQSSKKNMAQTCQSGFSSYTRYYQDLTK